ncbi:hypothetical protein H6P81_002993 [Aristolochia fimbriata]|uniref:EF-hand domain-containing protein n=1 Tax=Aristolochia fimbriata TaxID=158543 RepID=A0AAV7FE88_ARIFI|nr:hypothetical protein H6P81_002993 [Aristolochia fimbriata]
MSLSTGAAEKGRRKLRFDRARSVRPASRSGTPETPDSASSSSTTTTISSPKLDFGGVCEGGVLWVPVLRRPRKGLITSESLRRNSGVVGMEGMSREDAEEMVKEGDLDGDDALNEIEDEVSGVNCSRIETLPHRTVNLA